MNFCRIREIFRNFEKNEKNVGYCGKPNRNLLEEFLVKKNVKCDIDKFMGSMENIEIVVEEESEEESVQEETESDEEEIILKFE